MANLDLDKVHAASREANGEAPTVTLGGKTYTLPVKMPLAVAIAAAEQDLRLMVEALFGDDDAETVAKQLDVDDLEDLAALYGVDRGNSQPSAG